MTELVRHHAGDFAVGARGFDHSAVQEHRSARKRERVDLAQIDHVERVAECWLPQVIRDLGNEPVADVFDERIGALIVEYRQLTTHFRRRLPAELDILLGGIAVLVRFYPRLRAQRQRERGCDCRNRRGFRRCPPRVGSRKEWSSHARVRARSTPMGVDRESAENRPDSCGETAQCTLRGSSSSGAEDHAGDRETAGGDYLQDGTAMVSASGIRRSRSTPPFPTLSIARARRARRRPRRTLAAALWRAALSAAFLQPRTIDYHNEATGASV